MLILTTRSRSATAAVAGALQLAVVAFAFAFARRLRRDPLLHSLEHAWGSGAPGSGGGGGQRWPEHRTHNPAHATDDGWEVPAVPKFDVDVGEVAEAAAAEEEEEQEHTPLWTMFVVTVCLLVLILTIVDQNGIEPWPEGNMLVGPSEQTLIKWGAKDVRRIRSGEWWRLLTAMWLHGGVIHWLVNTIGLISLVPPPRHSHHDRNY
jgi:hypothetical protein